MSAFKRISTVLSEHSPKRSSSPGGSRTPTGLSDKSANGVTGPASHKRGSIAAILHKFDRHNDTSSGTETSETDSDDHIDDATSKNAAKRMEKKRRKKEIKARLSLERGEPESEERLKQRLDEARARETDDMRIRYGELPMSQSTTRNTEQRIDVDTLTEDMIGTPVIFRARMHHHRNMGTKLAFVMLRQRISTIQGVLVEEPGKVGPLMMHWAEHVRTGSIMRIRGIVQKPAVPIKSASIHNLEVGITHLHIIVKRAEPVPFSVQEAELQIQDEEHKYEGVRQNMISDRTRLSNRIIDLRTATSQSIFRIQAAVGNMFRYELDERGFIEIHSPKLQGAATESGASVFKVGYFGRNAFLAQSPQLAKQMAIAGDFERVYEIGAVFRAENSNTHRHLTEYTGLDFEMALEEHYWEAMDVIDDVLKAIFKGLYTRFRREIEVIKEQFPSEDLVWLEQTPRIKFADAIQLLNDSGWLNEEGEQLSPLEDLGTRDEIHLGQLIKEKFGTDYYILDKFPRSARPFYSMPDPEDPRFTNAFDIFRIHDAAVLEENMRAVGIDPEDMAEYMEGFRWAAPPHAGIGVGLERIVMLILKLGNIRLASLFHRDPKSFPQKPVVEKLPHPDADTLNPTWTRERGHIVPADQRVMPDLYDLIANYGDATSTSWGDARYKIWRDTATGAAVSYVPEGRYAILPGEPLCHQSQYYTIVSRFLTWLKRETKLKPIWILVSREVADVLGERLGWKTLSPVLEERVDATKKTAETDPEVARKIRRAKELGVKVIDFKAGSPIPEDIKTRANARVKDWLANRKGTQIHLSNIDLFRDEKHRRYHIAEDTDGNICGIGVLAQLAPRHGWQAKYTLDFPNAPSGTIEYITTHALSEAAAAGIEKVTFGGGAAPHLTPGHNLSGARLKMLQGTYDAIVKQFNLVRKSEFREKMGAIGEPQWIAYPPGGLGSSGRGIKALMRYLQDE
ncbi:aspartate--tRNA ligase dps1 [Lithohypha guttulata]|nr:aspartate--tRNA ligase dps1 [Lithohypha guttulata]